MSIFSQQASRRESLGCQARCALRRSANHSGGIGAGRRETDISECGPARSVVVAAAGSGGGASRVLWW